MRRLSIRWRLTLWYSAVLAGVLAVFGISVYLLMQRGLQNPDQRESVDPDDRDRGPALSLARAAGFFAIGSNASMRGIPRLISRSPLVDGTIWMRGERIRDRGLPRPSKSSRGRP